MISDHPNEHRLPKWARQLLNELRIENQAMKERLLQLGLKDSLESNVTEIHPVFGERPLPEDAIISFRKPKADLTVFHGPRNQLRIDCNRPLRMYSGFANSVTVEPVPVED